MAKKINSQFDFFKEVYLDDEGNLGVSVTGKESIDSIINTSEKATEIELNTGDTKQALVFMAEQLEDIKNLLKLILS